MKIITTTTATTFQLFVYRGIGKCTNPSVGDAVVIAPRKSKARLRYERANPGWPIYTAAPMPLFKNAFLKMTAGQR